MQNYDGQFKLNGQEYFYRAKDDSGSSKITRVNNEEHHYRMVEIHLLFLYSFLRRWCQKAYTNTGTFHKGISIDFRTKEGANIMKRYGYHRTSTREQHLDRGIKEITTYCEQNNLELEKIFTDQQIGKNFNRPRYQVLKEDVLRAGGRKAPEHDR